MRSALLLSLVSLAFVGLLGRSRTALDDSPESILEPSPDEEQALFIG